MSRPPSARPKTSAGRAASAARQRPVTRASQPDDVGLPAPIARPASRNAVSRSGAVEPPRAVSRAVMSRSGSSAGRSTEGMERLATASRMMRPPSSAIRPVTQQGLSGVRAQSRLGTASQRRVMDKSYFMGLMRGKLTLLNEEIARLEQVLEDGEKDRQQMNVYESKAEEKALEIRELQGKLADLNMVVDKVHTGMEMTQIAVDAKDVRMKADEVAASVEELFAERRAKEAMADKIQTEIEEQKKLNQAIMSSMESGIRLRYEECKKAAEAMKEELDLKQGELSELERKRTQLENELNSSPLKQKAIELHERAMELKEKERLLLEEKENAESPEERKQKLLEQVRRNNEEIAVIEKQIEQVNEQIEMGNEELREFDNDFETIAGEQNERYRELKRKETQMEEFLAAFDEQKRLLQLETEECSDAVLLNLARIGANIASLNVGENVTTMDPSGLVGSYTQNSTAEELQHLHVRLQEELLSFDELEARLKSELDSFGTKEEELQRQMVEFSDTETLRKQVKDKFRKIEDRKRMLEREVPAMEGNELELRKRLQTITAELDSSEEYRQIRAEQRKLAEIAKECSQLRQVVTEREADTQYEEIKEEVLRLRETYNEWLKTNATKK